MDGGGGIRSCCLRKTRGVFRPRRQVTENKITTINPPFSTSMNTYWLYLLLAGIFEIGWPLGFKLSHGSPHKLLWIALSVISMALSGYFLYLAQKVIPIGTAYVVWTGIGAVGTLVIGILFFGDSASLMRLGAALLVIVGVVGIKVAS